MSPYTEIVALAQEDLAEAVSAWTRAARDYRDAQSTEAHAAHAALVAAGCEMPECWCGCGEPAVAIESDSGDMAAEGCRYYAVDDDGESVCECDPRVVDDGQWTGGGMHGCGTGWVSRLVVREASR